MINNNTNNNNTMSKTNKFLVSYDNGKKVLCNTKREAVDFINVLLDKGHVNITLNGKNV